MNYISIMIVIFRSPESWGFAPLLLLSSLIRDCCSAMIAQQLRLNWIRHFVEINKIWESELIVDYNSNRAKNQRKIRVNFSLFIRFFHSDIDVCVRRAQRTSLPLSLRVTRSYSCAGMSLCARNTPILFLATTVLYLTF